MDRLADFKHIKEALPLRPAYESPNALLIEGDSLESIKRIPDRSVSLLLTDPPYHSTKKANIVNDRSFSSDEEFVSWMEKHALEWRRVLRPNGSAFMFCSSAMEPRLSLMLSAHFNVLSHIVWTKPNEPGFDGWKGKMKKEALRQWYPQSERIIFFEPAQTGNLKRSYFGNLLRRLRAERGLSGHELTKLIGAYGKVNHGGAVSNWETGRNIPSREQYARLSEVFRERGPGVPLPPYEDAIRPFEVNAHVEFTDVWNFPSVRPYKGKHPAEKPLEMLEHCINATTFENDIVLDCFAGSGSTLLSALRTHRYAVGIEIDSGWCASIKEKLQAFESLSKSGISSGIRAMDGRRLMQGCVQMREAAPTLFPQ